jgi:DNA-binding LytR/AlgR family response regulator
MKIRIDANSKVNEPEIVIKCNTIDDEVLKVQSAIMASIKSGTKLLLESDDKDYYLSPNQILFFEATDGKTYAHTLKRILRCKMKLYELERSLPGEFVRVSKSTIVNTKEILAITRNLTGPSIIQFRGSYKQTSASRSYFKSLQNKLTERRI